MADSGGPNTRVFLAGLPPKVTEDDVRTFFEGCGGIAAVDLKTTLGGKSAGYGFVIFEDVRAVPKAVARDGNEMMGKWVKVQEVADEVPVVVQEERWPTEEDKPPDADGKRRPRPRPKPQQERKPSPKPENCTRIFAWSVPYDMTEQVVREFFGKCGEITDVFLPKDRETGKLRGTLFVTFKETESTDKAVELNGEDLGGRAARIDFAKPRDRAPPPPRQQRPPRTTAPPAGEEGA